MTRCRLCGCGRVSIVGAAEYYEGYSWTIPDCLECGCRFTEHENVTYELLHSAPRSRYGMYRDFAEQANQFFRAGDKEGLKSLLSMTSKYRFVIGAVERLPKDARILEIGCSR